MWKLLLFKLLVGIKFNYLLSKFQTLHASIILKNCFWHIQYMYSRNCFFFFLRFDNISRLLSVTMMLVVDQFLNFSFLFQMEILLTFSLKIKFYLMMIMKKTPQFHKDVVFFTTNVNILYNCECKMEKGENVNTADQHRRSTTFSIHIHTTKVSN